MPRLAALSIAERSAVISAGFASAVLARLLRLRIRVRTLRFLSERRSVCRARLAADLVFAIDRGLEAHGSHEFCQQTRRDDQARPFCWNNTVDFFVGAAGALGGSGVIVAFSAPGLEESAANTAWVTIGVGACVSARTPFAAGFSFGNLSGVICTIAPSGS